MSEPVSLARLLDDQSDRWTRGERPAVEAYLRQHPHLCGRREFLLDLIYNEVVLRCRRGERPQVEEYVDRFPDLADDLRDQFEVHAALASVPTVGFPPAPARREVAAPVMVGPGTILGRHLLLEKLGEGGMGAVFRARHQTLDRIDALKVIRPDLLHDPAVLARFYQEARSAARLSHKNIVTIHDAGAADGQHFLVMEFVAGTDLARVLHQRRRLSAAAVRGVLYQVARGLEHLHGRGLIHRDLKPSNLLLAQESRQVKILDLGLACLRRVGSADRLTAHAQILGTPDYIAPEQTVSARAVDIRADLYALGCTAYHLLAGAVPFPGGDLFDKIQRHRQEAPPPLDALCPDLPGDLSAVINRLMAKDPADRFQTPADLAAAVRAPARLPQGMSADDSPTALTAEIPPARPDRRRLLIGLGVAGLVTAGAGVVAGVALFRASDLVRTGEPGTDPPGINPNPGPSPEVAGATNWRVVDTLRPQAGNIFGIAYAPDGAALAIACGDYDAPEKPGAVLLCALPARRWETVGESRHSAARVLFAPDGETLISATGSPHPTLRVPGEVVLWHLPRGPARKAVPLFARADVTGLTLSPDGRVALVSSPDGVVKSVDLATGQDRRLRQGGDGYAWSADPAWANDGRLLAWPCQDGRVPFLQAPVWNFQGGATTTPDHRVFVSGVAFRAGDSELVGTTGSSESHGSVIRIWAMPGGRILETMHAGDLHLFGMALAPDGRTLAVGNQGGQLQIWDMQTRTRTQLTQAHAGMLRALAFAPGGQTLATGGADGLVRLWERTLEP